MEKKTHDSGVRQTEEEEDISVCLHVLITNPPNNYKKCIIGGLVNYKSPNLSVCLSI